MARSIPPWLKALQPLREPTLRRLSPYSTAEAWHVDVEFTPWQVPPGASLTGSQTWNGKALIESADPNLDAGVGEVELAVRLRSAMPTWSSYWTGRPPKQWSKWSLTTELRERETWLIEFDRRVRDLDPSLGGHQRGWPDVVAWESGIDDLVCVEYKGPRPSQPDVLDDIKVEQDAWFRATTGQRDFDIDRYAVAIWVPSTSAMAVLSEQRAASTRGAATRRRRTGDRKTGSGSPSPVAGQHGDEKLHRRTIRKVLIEKTGARVVSKVHEGAVDVEVPASSDVAAFREEVVREVRLMGYEPTVEVMARGSGGATIRVSTPETLALRGRGAHGAG